MFGVQRLVVGQWRNLKTQLTRILQGQRSHSLTINVPSSSDALGLSLQLAPLNSTQNIWHVLNIPSSLSPAHQAGLLPHSDYVLGSPSGTLKGEGALGELVEDHLNRSLVLWVYNSEFDVVREVELVPRRGWGGEGALGAVLGFGALHRLPVGLGEEVQAPGENMFDAESKSLENGAQLDHDSANTFQPAPAPILTPPPMINPNIAPPPLMNPNAPPPGSSNPPRGRKGKHHGAPGANLNFDDMFAEGAKRVRNRIMCHQERALPLHRRPGRALRLRHPIPQRTRNRIL